MRGSSFPRWLLIATLVGGWLAAPAQPASASAASSYGGSTSGSLVALSALTVPGTLNLANAEVAPADAEVASDSTLSGGVAAHARAANLDANLINDNIAIDNQLVSASQSAPPDNATAVTKQFLGLPVAPLLAASAGNATAHARWIGGPPPCLPAGTPIARGISTLASADVLTGTPLGSAAVSVVNANGGAVTTDSAVALVNIPGQTNLGVQATTLNQLTSIILFKGSANELDVNVVAPPVLTATASGNPGGAKVAYAEPILQVFRAGKLVGTLDAASVNQSVTVPGVATLSLGTLTKTEAADGTSASGSASLLDVHVGISPLPVNLATITVAGASVSAHVPAGGVVCDNPLREAKKDLSATSVAPGQTFSYTVTVPNRASCVLDNVKVVDTITAPAGTSVVSTDPPADSVNALVLTWNDIGPINPNVTKNLQITVRAPADMASGAQFANHADISATCNGTTITQPADVSGPTGYVPAVGVPCRLGESNKAASHLEVFPGETFDYYIHVLNDGGQPCNGTTVTDSLDSTVNFVACSDGCTANGSTLTWYLGTLAPGASRTLVVTVVPAAADQLGIHLPDSATIAATGAQATVHTDGPVLSGRSVLAPPLPATPAGGAAPPAPTPPATPTGVAATETLPFTGAPDVAPGGLGLLVAGMLLAGWNRRRSTRLSGR